MVPAQNVDGNGTSLGEDEADGEEEGDGEEEDKKDDVSKVTPNGTDDTNGVDGLVSLPQVHVLSYCVNIAVSFSFLPHIIARSQRLSRT